MIVLRFNVSLGEPSVLLMDSGAHVIREFTCSNCGTYLGWKIMSACEMGEKWKDGRFIFELDRVIDVPQIAGWLAQPQQERRGDLLIAQSLGHRRSKTDPSVQVGLSEPNGEVDGPRSRTMEHSAA